MKNLIIILTALLIVVSCKQKKHDEYGHDMANMEAGSTYYTCSMHPQIVANKPGKCPICHMDLVAVKKDNNEKDILQLSDQQIQLGNIHTDTVKNGNLADQLITTGILNFDQDKKIAISARVMGRIEKLYYKNNGEFVQKGAPVFAIYSEELNNAKQEYIHALERAKTFENGAVTVVNLQQLVESAKNKLLLWGMTESQIKELAQSKKASL
jgi:Cu(I)/Ag(I) efflux system membrane fusion protein